MANINVPVFNDKSPFAPDTHTSKQQTIVSNTSSKSEPESEDDDNDNDGGIFHEASATKPIEYVERFDPVEHVDHQHVDLVEKIEHTPVPKSESVSPTFVDTDTFPSSASSSKPIISSPPSPSPLPTSLPAATTATATPAQAPSTRNKKSFFWNRKRSSTNTSTFSIGSLSLPSLSNNSSTSNFDLLLSRMTANQKSSKKAKEIVNEDGLTELKARFKSLRDQLDPGTKDQQNNETSITASSTPPPASSTHPEINWGFWDQVVNNYSSLAKKDPAGLSLTISRGIPFQLRGLVWQVIAGSKSTSLEDLYDSIVVEESPNEQAIRKDISEANFALNNTDSESLYKVVKAYSLFDPEVGYAKEMLNIVVPLLNSLNESEAFDMLVKLMKGYQLRDFFILEHPGLNLHLYLLDRILEKTIPQVYSHLTRQGVRSNMYASQWFLTLFTDNFPLLSAQQRIIDVVVAEGIESLLKFAVCVMKRNSSTILSLEDDQILPFLNDNIFDFYLIKDVTNTTDGILEYRIDDLIADAFDVKILPVQLKKYSDEYSELHRVEKERAKELEDLRSTNEQLSRRAKRLDSTVTELTEEHLTVTNELANERTKTANLQAGNEALRAAKTDLNKKLGGIGENAPEQLAKLRDEAAQLQRSKLNLETQLTNLERQLAEAKLKYEQLEGEHSKLNQRWSELRKALVG